ncbi:hypothetical protein DB32_001337 [Sandaracinus amylolyticus]|uniref:Uncharacterized protein n=1 Tax=Sandaracinus amylolyticus TaxID=927083 RepID=A0A0F6YG05_9BACT|nr:hypothetical protein DB32_001337 [Sandaracinus amylolyticus]
MVLVPGDAGAQPVGTIPAPGSVVIDVERELMITDLSVVEDPVRTEWSAPEGTPGRGVWTFGHLVSEMAGDLRPGELVMQWLREWEVEQQFGDSIAPARPPVRTLIIDPWLARSGCAAGATTCNLDLTTAPFRLLAIVNRLDLRDAELSGPGGSEDAHTRHAGEGRFVFGVLGPAGERLRFTVIFEYTQVADTAAEVQQWAQRWHALGALPFGPDYNAALEQVTHRFAGANMAPDRPNGSAIAQVRTNEIAITPIWELREFLLSESGLRLAPIQQTPDFSENGTNKLRNRIRSHAAAILDGSYRVPPGQLGAIGPTPTSRFFWDAPGLTDHAAARHQFSLTTCSGCHAGETATRFLHVGTREAGVEAVLSGFLVGAQVADPVTGEVRAFADLDRRAADMVDVLTATLDTVPPRGRGMSGARPH